MTKLLLTDKTDDIMCGTRDVDQHRQFRGEWVKKGSIIMMWRLYFVNPVNTIKSCGFIKLVPVLKSGYYFDIWQAVKIICMYYVVCL